MKNNVETEEKMEMAWTRVPNVTWRTAQDSLTLDSRWKKETWSPKRNMETNSGEGDERMWPDMEHHHQMGCRPTAVALSC